MCAIAPIYPRLIPLLVLLSLAMRGERLMAQSGSASNAAPIRLLEIEGQRVEVLRAGATAWDPASIKPPYSVLKPGDQLRTGERSRAVVRWHDLTVLRVNELSRLQIPAEEKKKSGFNFLRGIFYFFHRDTPGEFELRTPTVAAVVRGTEFGVAVDAKGKTTLRVTQGKVELQTTRATVLVPAGMQTAALPGRAPQSPVLMVAAAKPRPKGKPQPGTLHVVPPAGQNAAGTATDSSGKTFHRSPEPTPTPATPTDSSPQGAPTDSSGAPASSSGDHGTEPPIPISTSP